MILTLIREQLRTQRSYIVWAAAHGPMPWPGAAWTATGAAAFATTRRPTRAAPRDSRYPAWPAPSSAPSPLAVLVAAATAVYGFVVARRTAFDALREAIKEGVGG